MNEWSHGKFQVHVLKNNSKMPDNTAEFWMVIMKFWLSIMIKTLISSNNLSLCNISNNFHDQHKDFFLEIWKLDKKILYRAIS